MVVDQETFRSPMEPKIHCVWIEAGERRHASFREGVELPRLAMSLAGTFRTCRSGLTTSVHWGKAEHALERAEFRV
jgi:hypothetical protein